MRKKTDLAGIGSAGLLVVISAFVAPRPAGAQVRGVYPLGMSATNSGLTPESGLLYSNLFLFYSRHQLKGPEGELLASGRQSVLMDMNTFVWASERKVIGGARFLLAATLPIANNSLTSDARGALGGGGGLGDSYYQPFILGWQLNPAALKLAYGFLAPTGRFDPEAADNVGSGYWTHALSSGQTFYLGEDKKVAVSSFQMYEFHGAQKGTQVHPGQTLDIDYSLTQLIALQEDLHMQVGLVGYGQWQTTDKTGPGITPAEAAARYRVNALGFGWSVMLPVREVSLDVKYFKEFSNRSTVEGYSLQISGAVHF